MGFPSWILVGSFGLKSVGALEEVGEGGLGTGICHGKTQVGKAIVMAIDTLKT